MNQSSDRSRFTMQRSRRSLKRERTRRKILENAIALFAEQGVRATRTREIADRAEVSIATFFNHFATKERVVDAWVRGEISESLKRLAEADGQRGLRGPLRRLGRELADSQWPTRKARSEAWRVIGSAPEDPERRCAPLEGWVEAEQARGRIRGDLAAVAIADLLVSTLEGALSVGLQSAETGDELSREICSRLDLVLDGTRKRNERVIAVPATSEGNLPAR